MPVKDRTRIPGRRPSRPRPEPTDPGQVKAAKARASAAQPTRDADTGPRPAPSSDAPAEAEAAAWRRAGEAFATRFWHGQQRRPTPAELLFVFERLKRVQGLNELGAGLAAAEAAIPVRELEQGARLEELLTRFSTSQDQVPNDDPLLVAFTAGAIVADIKQVAPQTRRRRPRVVQLELFAQPAAAPPLAGAPIPVFDAPLPLPMRAELGRALREAQAAPSRVAPTAAAAASADGPPKAPLSPSERGGRGGTTKPTPEGAK